MTNPNPQDYPGAQGNPPPQGGYPPPPQGGYPPPPQGGYPPQPPPGGFPPPAPGYGAPMQPPPGYADSDEKTWALIATFGAAGLDLISGGTGGWLAGLIAYLAKGTPNVKAHAKASLNFQIPVNVACVLLFVLRSCAFAVFGFGGLYSLVNVLFWLIQVALIIGGIAFGVIAGMKANEGSLYKYPLPFTIIK